MVEGVEDKNENDLTEKEIKEMASLEEEEKRLKEAKKNWEVQAIFLQNELMKKFNEEKAFSYNLKEIEEIKKSQKRHADEYHNILIEIKRIKFSIEEWKTCPTINTEIEKGKCKFIEFPFETLVNLDMSNHRKGNLLDSRKPDVVFIRKGLSFDPLNVEIVLELKTKRRNYFRNEDIGHIAAFAEKVLQFQPQRPFIYGVLTDCYYIMFIKVQRSTISSDDFTNKFKYEFTKKELLKYGNQGWNCFATLLVQNKSHDNTIVAVKILKYEDNIEKEVNILKKLETLNSSNISPILFSNSISIVMPLYEKVNNLQKKDISPLVKTIKRVHDSGILHRDLRKCNLLRDANSGSVVICDWGYSVFINESNYFAGGLEIATDDILQNLIEGENEFIYECQFDLISFVRMFYLMLHCPTLKRLSHEENWISKNEIIISTAKKMQEFCHL
ncbi:16081_t:CDS:2 [Funneliformis caledonium]|uniref:16081_t:CDS:1 n=1 Tax=Funneliformis caledonium TaxID=1117310 RepID=A0A9N9DLT9_9GLOM|nr:16081_t:CDS:2 [Funneliformis caledonium]